MKILLVHNSYQQPGGEDVVFSQERELLLRAGHRVVSYQRSNDEIKDCGLIERLASAKRAIWSTDTRREFADLLLRQKPQLVHIHNTFMAISPSIYFACKDAGVPVVQTLHNYRLLCPAATFFRDGKVCRECVEHSLWRGVSHGCYRHSRLATATTGLMLTVHSRLGTWRQMVNCYVALTDFARRTFVEGGLPADKLTVKPNFVHPDPCGCPAVGDCVLYAGRLSEEKGLWTLLKAWEHLRRAIPLVIVGEGLLRRNLEVETARRGLTCVSFRGHLRRDRMLALMKQARFLICPSECFESFPMTIVEAFACATPVLGSRLGAIRELVEDGRTGLHFAPGDARDLSEKVEWAWNHPGKIAAFGKAARCEYEAKYTAEKNYARLMEIYERALAI